jgi:hypothetical protein
MDRNDRIKAIAKSLLDYLSTGNKRTESIDYRGLQRSLEVVRLNSSVPLLNHDNSRIVAQLKTHPHAKEIAENPTSAQSQDFIANILRRTEKYLELKQELVDMGQKNPGIITRNGVLVNGNTRLVAIRDANIEGFDVAVLPEDATSEDFFDIEMALQVRKLIHQDYTFTNRLLLISRYLARDHSEEELCKRMGWKQNGKKNLALNRQMLALVEEIREASLYPLDYSFFDDKETMMKDLEKSFDLVSNDSMPDAEQMKWLRIMGMVLGVNKDQVRAIDETFLEDALIKRVKGTEAEVFLQKFESVRGQDSLDELLGTNPTGHLPKVDLRAAVTEILNTTMNESGFLNEEKLENFHELKKHIRTGADSLIDEEKQNQLRSQPSERLSEARMRIEEIADRLPDLFKMPGFDQRKFEFESKKALKSIISLNEELQRQITGQK